MATGIVFFPAGDACQDVANTEHADKKAGLHKLRNRDVVEIFKDKTVSFNNCLKAARLENTDMDVILQIDRKVLQSKVTRIEQKIKKYRKSGKYQQLNEYKNAFFEPPKPRNDAEMYGIVDDVKKEKLKVLQHETANIVLENRSLKRHVEYIEDENDMLQLQAEQCDRKVSLLMSLLDITTSKQQEILATVKNKEQIQLQCQAWENKYNEISNLLENTLEELHEKGLKLKMSCTRNQNKKMKRRDQKIEIQKTTIEEKDTEIQILREELNQEREISKKKDDQLVGLKADKRNLLVKVCRLSKKVKSDESQVVEREINHLKEEIRYKENRIEELVQLHETLENPVICAFKDGKYVNEVRETIMSLVSEHGVSQRKVNGVIETVLTNLAGKSLNRLPSTGVRSRLMIEAKRVAQIQVTEAMLSGDGGNSTTLLGNCLHQDGTSKFHRHFQSFQVTTPEHKTYSLGITEVASGDAKSILDSFKNHLKDLGNAIKTYDQNKVSELVGSIVSTMSDQGATNPLFNQQLQELKNSVMPEIVENWESMDTEMKTELSKISNYFCKMHVFVNMASEVDKCLAVAEESICEGRNPFSLGWKESGGARLVRTVSKALTMQGCEKSGIGHHFATYLKEKGKKNLLVTFRGHRFNHLFCVAGRTYYHHQDIHDFLQKWSDPNDLLKSVAFDIAEISYLSSVRSLGIIDKLITGPFWRVIESKTSILEVNPYLEQLRNKLEIYTADASSLLQGESVFSDFEPTKDEIYQCLFNDHDPVMDTYTQMALELALGGMQLILERQAKDQLEGGKYYDPDGNECVRALSVPTTNTCSERDFAQLDVLMRLKPSASTECYESVIMWSNNKTSQWLLDKSESERSSIIAMARRDIPSMMSEIKNRKNKLHQDKVEKLNSKQEQKLKKEEKIYNENVKLTAAVTRVGGLWMTIDEIDNFVETHSKDETRQAIVAQLQFRKQVLKSNGTRELFQQQHQGKVYTLQELGKNLKSVIHINKDNENQNEADSEKLTYKTTDDITQNIKQAKERLAERIATGRQKILMQQQKSLLPGYTKDPETLVQKNIKHKFKLQESGTFEWFKGQVLKLVQSNGKKSKFEVLYEDEEESCIFPLLVDLERGDLLILQ